jgi:hypothetical protein
VILPLLRVLFYRFNSSEKDSFFVIDRINLTLRPASGFADGEPARWTDNGGGTFSQGKKTAPAVFLPWPIHVKPLRGSFWKRALKCPPDISVFAQGSFALPGCKAVTFFVINQNQGEKF